MWLFWASFARMQKHFSYLTYNFQFKAIRFCFFPSPRCNYAFVPISYFYGQCYINFVQIWKNVRNVRFGFSKVKCGRSFRNQFGNIISFTLKWPLLYNLFLDLSMEFRKLSIIQFGYDIKLII